MRLIENKLVKVNNEMYNKVFENHVFWSMDINIYLNQKILLSTLVTSNYLIRDIHDEINR